MENYKFFQNQKCEYFPCHRCAKEDDFNCLFCYCPLYALGPACGGDFYYTSRGIKDCTGCTRLHRGDDGARIVREAFGALATLAAEHAQPQRGDA